MGSGILIKKAIKKYGIENFEKKIIIQNIPYQNEINRLEIYYIKLYREYGMAEYNIAAGGKCGSFSKTEEQKRKLSEINKGEKNPNFGKHPSEKTRKKMSIAHKNITDETRQKISIAGKGKKHSDKTKQKMSEAKKRNKICLGRFLSEETKRKISEAEKGKIISEETKQKMSESQRKRWEYVKNGGRR
jgi:hypothetical protein